MKSYFLKTPIGNLRLTFEAEILVEVAFLHHKPKQSIYRPSRAQAQTLQQITAYFKSAKPFSLPLAFQWGTPFQQRVWQALQQIPLGQTRTYGELAKELNTSARAVGMACRTNPLPLVVPCHRVVGATAIGGFCGTMAGKPISVKQWLLDHEAKSS